jgi:hypothetical protein
MHAPGSDVADEHAVVWAVEGAPAASQLHLRSACFCSQDLCVNAGRALTGALAPQAHRASAMDNMLLVTFLGSLPGEVSAAEQCQCAHLASAKGAAAVAAWKHDGPLVGLAQAWRVSCVGIVADRAGDGAGARGVGHCHLHRQREVNDALMAGILMALSCTYKHGAQSHFARCIRGACARSLAPDVKLLQ